MTGPTQQTVKRLFALSRNRCAFHNCETPIVHASGAQTGDICHIRAASRGGPRYDPNQTPNQRHAFENLILLCKVHHQIVDHDLATFTVDLLADIKAMHEKNGDIELSPEAARMAEQLYASLKITVTAGRDAQVMVGSPGSVQAKTIKAEGPFVFTEKHTTRNVIQPGPEHVTDEQAGQIKAMIDELADIDVRAGRPDSHGGWFKRLYRKFPCRNSYHLIRREHFPAVMQYLRVEAAKARPKLRRTDNAEWRNRFYRSIWVRARELGMSRDQVHDLATERLRLKKPLRSLTELGEQNLERFYRMVLDL